MDIKCGLEFETYKHVHGVRNKVVVPDEEKKISMNCGRNDRAAVQLLLYSDSDMLVCVNGNTAFYERGSIDVLRISTNIPGMGGDRITTRLIGLVEDDDRQLKADMLLEQAAIHVDAKKIQCVWIEVEIGKDVRPGTYKPRITLYGHRMFEEETVLKVLDFEINVLDMILDDPQQYKFNLDLWQHNSNIARKYDVELWGTEHFKIIENYIESLAALGQKAISVVVSEIPWSGQFSFLDRLDPVNLFEYNIVKVRLDKNGEWQYDFSKLNEYIELCIKHGISEEIEVFGLINIWLNEEEGFGGVIKDYSDGIRIRYFDEKSETYKYVLKKSDLETYISALERNFIARGWIDKVRIMADEPANIECFIGRMNVIRKAAPSFQFKIAVNHATFIEKGINGITDYSIILTNICECFDRLKNLKKEVKGRLSYYVCCGPDVPNTFISSHLLESRLIPWLAWYLRVDGFLRWNYTVWPNDPLNKISYHYPLFRAGDTNFVYPGRDGKPMLTLRYKSLQKGIRDYEIIRRYDDKIKDTEKINKMLKKVFLWSNIDELHINARRKSEELFSLDYEVYESIIEEMMTQIIEKYK